MIRVWCRDVRLLRDIESDIMLLGAEVAAAIDMADLERSVGFSDCTVLVIADHSDEELCRELLQKLNGVTPRDATTWPMVLVGHDTLFTHSTILAQIPQVTVPQSRIKTELLDAILQETARAALQHARCQARAMPVGTVLRTALLILLNSTEAVSTVTELAARVHVRSSTLHHHWIQGGLKEQTGMSLKTFLRTILLVKVRARMTPRIDVRAAAVEYGTTAKHLRAIYRSRFGSWRGRDRGGWLIVAQQIRSWRN